MRLIEEGLLDEASIVELAERLGVGPRHLLRLFLRHTGASPSDIAATRRVQAAKRLIDQTTMPLCDIAFAASFRSVRRFNDAFRATYGRSPSSFRKTIQQVNLGELGPGSKSAPRLWGTKPDLRTTLAARHANPDSSRALMMRRFIHLFQFFSVSCIWMAENIWEAAMDAKNVNPLHTTKIVGSYLRHHTVGASQLPDLITSVHRSLSELGLPALVEEVLTPAVSARQSVRHDYVVCLECGYRGKTLRRHINTRHGWSRDEYLRRWGLQPDHALTAPAYSERRSTLARQLGLGRKPKAKGPATPTAADSPVGDGEERVEADHPTSGAVTRSGSEPDAVEAASRPTRRRQRRPRSRATSPQTEQLSPPITDA
jgi:predicted transcriptional regulator/AraC-like DNA-binding protein